MYDLFLIVLFTRQNWDCLSILWQSSFLLLSFPMIFLMCINRNKPYKQKLGVAKVILVKILNWYLTNPLVKCKWREPVHRMLEVVNTLTTWHWWVTWTDEMKHLLSSFSNHSMTDLPFFSTCNTLYNNLQLGVSSYDTGDANYAEQDLNMNTSNARN